jgi:hypothetical protein
MYTRQRPKTMTSFYMTENQKGTQLQRTQQQLDHLAWILDNCFRIPGTNWRFGIEALIGLIPGAGDIVSGVLGVILLFRAFQFKLPKIVIARMILNTLLDISAGAIPFLGDAFDFFFKSNTKNMRLFHQYAGEQGRSTRAHWIFLAAIVFGFAFVMCLIVIAFIWAFSRFMAQH